MTLLDTHILVWMLIAPEHLTARERKTILEARKVGPLAISAITLWEVAWLAENRRIVVEESVPAFVRKCASFVEVLPITPRIAARSVQFRDPYPQDPQDRIIGATAVEEGLHLLTRDKRIRQSRQVPLA